MIRSAQSQYEPYIHEDQKKHGQWVRRVPIYTTLNGDCLCALYIVICNTDSTYANISSQSSYEGAITHHRICLTDISQISQICLTDL